MKRSGYKVVGHYEDVDETVDRNLSYSDAIELANSLLKEEKIFSTIYFEEFYETVIYLTDTEIDYDRDIVDEYEVWTNKKEGDDL